MKLKRLTIALFSAMLLVSCGGSKKIVTTYPPAPAWVKDRPVSSGYYIGVGSARKTADINQTQQNAKQNALADMASDISVNISTNSLLSTFENSSNFSEDFSKTIKAQAEQDLEGYETVGNYEDQNNYWIYFRLSKADYQRIKEERRSKAVTIALDLFDKGVNAEKIGDVRLAFISFIKALEPLKPYFADPLQVQYQGKDIYLGNEISKEISGLLSSIRIEASNRQIKVKQGQPLAIGSLEFKVSYKNGQPLNGLTLSGTYTEKPLRTSKILTDNNGLASFTIDAIRSNKNTETLNATLNLENIANEATTDFIIRKLFVRFRAPEASISINIIKPLFYITSTESNLDAKLNPAPISEGLKRKILEGGYSTSDKEMEADYRISIIASTKSKGEVGNYKQTILNATISVKDKSGMEVYTKQLDNIMGAHFDYQQAGMEAYKEAVKKFENTISREIIEVVVKGKSNY
ncbi:MAG: hypothetical protein EHM93_18360 [Bacteroidales bacterium]|nr:MAG: hypothetical protein EHM93_18360 [Bacteroidales bacterium]